MIIFSLGKILQFHLSIRGYSRWHVNISINRKRWREVERSLENCRNAWLIFVGILVDIVIVMTVHLSVVLVIKTHDILSQNVLKLKKFLLDE